jgi:phosphoesterase RecJ-like protein
MIGTSKELIKRLVELPDDKKYEIKEYKERRSNDANAYFHVLVNQLARHFNIKDEDMKIKMNLDYGTIARFEDGRIKGCKVPKETNMKEIYKYSKWYKEDDDGYDCYIFYKETHTLNTKEMSQLINGVVQECEDAGIETKTESEIKRYDLAISVDCADLKIVAAGTEYFETAKMKIQIDHHSINTMYADYNFVNPVAPACCEVLIGMFEYFGIEITQELGTCIITGIITDTGGFQYSGVTAETFEFAAELLQKGVNISNVYQNVLTTKTKANFELSRIVSNRMEFFEEGKVAFTYMNLEDEKQVGAEEGDHEGLVNIGRNLEGVEVSIFIREKEGTNGYKISLRSKEYVNVADVALMLGGGGHIRAAGCFVQGSVEEVKEKVLSEIRKVLK